MNTFYITTPIYYANSLPHLGHLYTMIVADTVSRAKRQRGIDTYFLTGTDEHGINIERAAQKAGRTPKEQADYVVSYYKKMTSEFGLDTAHGGYDIFMRTTEPFHYQGVSELCDKSRVTRRRAAMMRYTKATTKAGSVPPVPNTKPKTSIRNRRTKANRQRVSFTTRRWTACRRKVTSSVCPITMKRCCRFMKAVPISSDLSQDVTK